MTSATPKPPGPGRPKDLDKRAAILAAGKHLFPSKGFEGTSMDAIAAEAGVSKLTVYSHFQDKDTLFQEVLKAKCEQQLPGALFKINRRAPLRRQLLDIGRGFFALIVSPDAMALHRMMTAQPSEKLGRLFWEAGPQSLVDHLAEFLAAETREGALDIKNPQLAAGQFFCLVKGQPHARLSYCCGQQLSAAETEAHLKSVVDLFLRAYGPR